MESNNEKLIEINYQPYTKKRYFFSVAELKFYELLKEIIGDNYFIYPKVRICDIIEQTNKGNYTDFNKIKSKHVDFLLCTKNPITSKIIVELDDSSHNAPSRQSRDAFVNEIFANSGIPIVHIKTQYEYRKDDIIKKLQEAYKTKYIVKKEDKKITSKNPGCGLALVLIPLLFSILMVTGCSIKNSTDTKEDFNYSMMVLFEAKNTLRIPEPYGIITQDFINEKISNQEKLIEKEKIEAGVAPEDVINWDYVNTEDRFYSLEYFTDKVAEKSVFFKNKQSSESIIFDSVYYLEGDVQEWKLLKSSITHLVDNKETKQREVLEINGKTIQNKSIWKCGELLNLCNDEDNLKSWGLIK